MEKSLTRPVKKVSGRDGSGRVAVRRRGGAHKRRLREIDFKRDKRNIKAGVISIEYDPNRTANIALLSYEDGDRRYILAPDGLKVGDQVLAADDAEIKVGNNLPLSKIPVGTAFHNLELTPGKGAQLVRGAGTAAAILSKEGKFATVRMPSGEIRMVPASARATIGQVGNAFLKFKKLSKAGETRLRGRRPSVRGVAQHPGSHPHGGGEGRSGIGMPSPKSPWGKKTLGKKTRRVKKYSDKFIIKTIKRRKKYG